MTIQEQVSQLDNNLAAFINQRRLSYDIFAQPESLQVRANSQSYFQKLQTGFAGQAERMAVVQRGWRFLTVAKLQGAILLPHFGSVKWVEIVEPTPMQEQSGQGGVVSARFVYEDLERLRTIFKNLRLPNSHGLDSIIVPIIGNQTAEFTEAYTEDILDYQVLTHEAVEVNLA